MNNTNQEEEKKPKARPTDGTAGQQVLKEQKNLRLNLLIIREAFKAFNGNTGMEHVTVDYIKKKKEKDGSVKEEERTAFSLDVFYRKLDIEPSEYRKLVNFEYVSPSYISNLSSKLKKYGILPRFLDVKNASLLKLSKELKEIVEEYYLVCQPKYDGTPKKINRVKADTGEAIRDIFLEQIHQNPLKNKESTEAFKSLHFFILNMTSEVWNHEAYRFSVGADILETLRREYNNDSKKMLQKDFHSYYAELARHVLDVEKDFL